MNETLKALRVQNGYSQSYLATYLEVSRQMYIKYENGEVEPPVRIIKMLCALYRVSSDLIIENKLGYSYENAGREVFYPDPGDIPLKVSEPDAVYRPVENQLLDELVGELKNLSKDSLKAVMAFTKFLVHGKMSSDENTADSDDADGGGGPFFIKKEFFDLCGNVDFDSEAINELREASFV